MTKDKYVYMGSQCPSYYLPPKSSSFSPGDIVTIKGLSNGRLGSLDNPELVGDIFIVVEICYAWGNESFSCVLEFLFPSDLNKRFVSVTSAKLCKLDQ